MFNDLRLSRRFFFSHFFQSRRFRRIHRQTSDQLSQEVLELVQGLEDYSEMKNEPREFDLIRKIRNLVQRSHPRTLFPLGDDGFVFQSFAQNTAIVQDMMVENVHFDMNYFNFADLGWKSLAVNLSDLAALGAKPHFAQVSLAIPDRVNENDVLFFYEGMMQLADQFKVEIVGGDLSHSPGPIMVDVSAIGEVQHPISRHSVKAGDFLYVTGPLGLSNTGLRTLQKQSRDFPKSIEKHLRPLPRLDWLPVLTPAHCRACIDVSDGLINEAMHLTRRLELGLLIWSEKIPIHPETVKWTQSLELAIECAFWGGEDYELLIAVGPEQKKLFEIDSDRLGLKRFCIGEFKHGSEIQWQNSAGTCKTICEFQGWKHF